MEVTRINEDEIELFNKEIRQIASALSKTNKDKNIDTSEFALLLEEAYQDFFEHFVKPSWREEGSELTVTDFKVYRENIVQITNYVKLNFNKKIAKIGTKTKRLNNIEEQKVEVRRSVMKSIKVLERIFKETNQLQIPLLLGCMNAVLSVNKQGLKLSL
jgi:Mg2+ and Co2+ transporter CorA